MSRIVWTAIEIAGFALIVAFVWFIWPPLTLLAGGLLMIAFALMGEVRASAKPVPDAEESP